MSLEFLESGDAVTQDGLAIPISNLPMVNVGEFVAGESTGSKEGTAMLGFGLALDNFYQGVSNLLGFTFTKGTVITSNLVTFTFSLLFEKYGNQRDGTYKYIPVPTTGANSGVGGVNIDSVFPNAEVVSATDVIGTDTTFNEECVVISNSDIANYSNSEVGAIGVDKRNWFSGVFQALKDIVTLRSTNNASAITATSNPNNFSTLTLPTTYYSTNDPLSDIPASDISGKLSTNQKTVSYSVQVQLFNNGSYEAHIVTS